jgi:hypothetical protein
MRRLLSHLLCATVLLGGLVGCDDDFVRNCPIIGRDPGTNIYNLDYELLIPADCPVPLASPGTEEKYAAGKIVDLATVDMAYASIEVENSSGNRKAYELVVFLGAPGYKFAEPRAKYTAATGTQQFTDYDVAKFRAMSQSGDKHAYGGTKITYRQTTLATRLTGENIPPPHTSHTWYAPVSGGYPGYMYQWYRDGSLVGNGSSYTGSVGTSDTNLRVEVTDQTWSTVAAVLAVDVGGIDASIDGPSLVYSSQGGGEWNVQVRGGTGAYTYQWYIDDQFVTNGPSLGGTRARADTGSMFG